MGKRAQQIERRIADSRKAREQAHASYVKAEEVMAHMEGRKNRDQARDDQRTAALRDKYEGLR